MNVLVVIDSNILVAYLDKKDKWHQRSLELIISQRKKSFDLVFFDCVLNETISVLARRAEEQNRENDFKFLMGKLEKSIHYEMINWISGEAKRLYEKIINLIIETNGKLNFHDALLGLICKELGIRTLLSFDKDFDMLDWIDRVDR
jgi:predicted nucleic acid-binding protein